MLPKSNQDKHFDFYDMKLMFPFVTNRIEFSISYVILLNMINAHLTDYMPYAHVLTAVFSLFHIPLPTALETKTTAYIDVTHVRAQIALDKCEPEKSVAFNMPSYLDEEDVFLADKNSVLKVIEEQKIEMKRLKDENVNIINRVTYLEGIAAASLNGNRQMDIDIGNLYQVQMSGNMIRDVDMFHVIEPVGVGIGGQGPDDFVDVNFGTVGFTAAMEESIK